MPTLRASIDVELSPADAFEALVHDLTMAWRRMGLTFQPGHQGTISQGTTLVARVAAWDPGERIRLVWHPADWRPRRSTEVEIRFDPVRAGTIIRVHHRNWGFDLGSPAECAGWFASEIVAPFLHVTTPRAFGDWLADRWARSPFGLESRAHYSNPLPQYSRFQTILDELAPAEGDFLLELGCGGGVLLREALRRGCRAVGIDHSPDMIAVARANNADALAEGRLQLLEGSAEALPFPDAIFTCATLAGVLSVLPDPAVVFAEVMRVLQPGGRLVALGTDPAERTIPEPLASRLRLYEDGELEAIASEAGFTDVRVSQVALRPAVPAEPVATGNERDGDDIVPVLHARKAG